MLGVVSIGAEKPEQSVSASTRNGADTEEIKNPMVIKNSYYALTVNGKTGSIESFSNGKKELIQPASKPRPLFTIRMRDSKGAPADLSALDAGQIRVDRETQADTPVIKMVYESVGNLPVQVMVKVRCPTDEPFTYWNLSVDHDTDSYVDYIDFPNVVVPDDLVGSGGDAKLFWPAMEGVVIENAEFRDRAWVKYSPIGYPNVGWQGYYPGPCHMQFMAYYGKQGGMYLAAHDELCNIKGIEWYKHDGGIKMAYRLFPGGIERGSYTMSYDMVMGVFDGDWYDAADIYRGWVENSKLPLPPKLSNNENIPQWYEHSPVVVTYPVRGTRDLGDMSPNEYYPYTQALPHLEGLSEAFDSKVMALLMHWEGSAPWAPPYVWPPFGGEDNFLEFVKGLHAKGNLAGVYCSGIAYTIKSNLCDYSREEEFKSKNLKEVMNVSPEGQVQFSKICSGPKAQRWSYDMCPANRFVGDVVLGEVKKIIDSGCDYIQYFDQNLGGACYFCYGSNHGHSRGPGLWMKEAMIDIYQRLDREMKRSGRKIIIGCEAAAAEPFIKYLLYNDLRFEIDLWMGIPVPAYAYLYHEYVNNFMGNQNNTATAIDVDKSPLNLHQRIAYSFIAGDMLTVVLADSGKIHWDWCTSWETTKPDQESVKLLIRNTNAWRKGVGKPFLYYGRMIKPYPIQGTYDIPMFLRQGGVHKFPSLFSSRWLSPDGRQAQMVVNYTKQEQEFILSCSDSAAETVYLYEDPSGKMASGVPVKQGRSALSIAPLSAIMVEFKASTLQ
jgi:hypothetical protein